jgi:hypothetical protein
MLQNPLWRFCNANSCLKPRVVMDHNIKLKWQAPLEDFVKVNSNIIIDRSTRKMSIGVIVRDCKEKVLAILSAPKDYIIDHGIAEAIAVLGVTIFCKELGHQRVVLEGDALQVVQVLQKEDKNLSKYDHQIEET